MNKDKINKGNFYAWLVIISINVLLSILTFVFINTDDTKLADNALPTAKALIAFSVFGFMTMITWVVLMLDEIKNNPNQLVGLVMGVVALTISLALGSYIVDITNNPLSHLSEIESMNGIVNGLTGASLVLSLMNLGGSLYGMTSKK